MRAPSIGSISHPAFLRVRRRIVEDVSVVAPTGCSQFPSDQYASRIEQASCRLLHQPPLRLSVVNGFFPAVPNDLLSVVIRFAMRSGKRPSGFLRPT